MKILVTGGAGFIGSHLTDKLFAEGHEVYALDDYSGGSVLNVSKATLIEADCRDQTRIDAIFNTLKPEVVYHLAANAAENKAQFSPIDITSRNYDAFIKVLTPFIKYGGKRFIFTSSIAVYGSLQTPFKETDKPEPEDLYGISKLAAEQTLKVMSKVHGFEYVIARPHNVYGPRQNMRDPYRNVVTIWMNAILRNQPLCVYGDGNQVRQFSYVDDVVDQLAKCLTTERVNKIFNVGSSKKYTLLDLAHMIKGIAESDAEVKHLPERPQEVKVAISDHRYANKYLGMCKTELVDGLNETWKWVKKQGPQEPIYTKIEIPSDKLPQNWKK